MKLDEEQTKASDNHNYQMKLNEGQSKALDVILSRQNVFLTGQGGVGKSELIKHVRERFEEMGKVVGVTALTGIAALNIKGSTLHRWAGIGLGESEPDVLLSKVRKHPKGKANWFNTSVLIVDEVSMLSPKLFTKLDYIGKNIRRCYAPFGGLQLIFCGDFCQLGPVKIDAYCFEAPLWDECGFVICHLTENMRQTDAEFQKLLSGARMGFLSPQHKDMLRSRIGAVVGNDEIRPTKLFSDRDSADAVNMKELKRLKADGNPLYAFDASDNIVSERPRKFSEDETKNYIGLLEKTCQAKRELILRVGAQVMLISNLEPDAGLVNGSRGVVIAFELINEKESRPEVKFLNGITKLITHHMWDFEVGDDIRISRTQLPLILAFACTCHKAQGLTLDCVEANLGDSIFAPGQFYTALSRVRSLEGLSLTQVNFDKLTCDPKVRDFYEKLEAKK